MEICQKQVTLDDKTILIPHKFTRLPTSYFKARCRACGFTTFILGAR